MSSSTVSGGVVGECAWWSAESVAEADRCGEGEEAGAEAVQGAGAESFERLEVVKMRFDPDNVLTCNQNIPPAA
jgi:hypothetical protein